MAIIDRLLLPALNHVLRTEDWARERLRGHAGAHLRVLAGALAVDLLVDGQGLFAAAASGAEPDVILRLPADLPVKWLVDRDNLFASVRLEGSVEVAETLGFVFRNLSWDVEADLAKLVGDIAAHRIVRGGRSLGRALGQGLRRSGDNLAEYLREDSTLLVAQAELAEFAKGVAAVGDDLARLERRVAALR